MIAQHLARKLLVFVLYSAAVTALPVLGSTPVVQMVRPLLQTQPPATVDSPATTCPCTPTRITETNAAAPARRAERWWCRGPVRRAVRGVALVVTRPWRR